MSSCKERGLTEDGSLQILGSDRFPGLRLEAPASEPAAWAAQGIPAGLRAGGSIPTPDAGPAAKLEGTFLLTSPCEQDASLTQRPSAQASLQVLLTFEIQQVDAQMGHRVQYPRFVELKFK